MNTRIISGLLLSMALFSCVRENNQPTVDGDRVAVEFQMGITTTRAHDGQWDANDDVGLTMIAQGTQSIIEDVYNYDYYTPSEAGIFQSRNQNKTIYFPQNGSNVTFKAYYPYIPALSRDMFIPVNVRNQTSLPQIDLMTADHLSGFSKKDRIVHLNFHHRLSKMIFKLSKLAGQEAIELDDVTVTIGGMYTEGSYDLLNEKLTVNPDTGAAITFPYRNDPADRYGIVLPRPAGTGVTFTFRTSNGSEYVAAMDKDLALDPGYKYTFYVTLQETEALITADIEPWIDGPTTYYDALQIGGEMGSNEGALEGDVMKVYLQGESGFGLLENYTYTGSAWNPDSPVYWEEIPDDPAILRASLEREEALNDTQMPDVLVSKTISVGRNKSAHFNLERAATKVFVVLKSTTFTPEQLNEATIVLPGYKTGGEVVDGAYVAGPADQREDIEVDRTDLTKGVAVFNPQDVSPGGEVVRVTINGRDYTAYAKSLGMSYQAGVANTLEVTLDEEIATVSARIVDWKEGTPSSLSVLEVGTPAGASENVTVGMEMTVFMENMAKTQLFDYKFTYESDGIWRTTPPIYWETLPEDTYTTRSWIIVNSEPLNSTQLPDYLVSEEIQLEKYYGANFKLTHAESQVVISLFSQTFSADELAAAEVVLPDYEVGGTFVRGAFIPGGDTGDILPEKDVDTGLRVALIQPQTVTDGGVILSVKVGDKTYYAKATNGDFEYTKGEITRITVYVEEDMLTVSATAKEWVSRDIELNALAPDVTTGTNERILDKERMEIYYTVGNEDKTATYIYNGETKQWTSSAPIFWDDIPNNTQMYATLFRHDAYHASQVADYMVLENPVTLSDTDAGVQFNFIHPASKVFVEVSSTVFTDEEIAAMTFTLPNYSTGGSVTRGVYTIGNTPGNITVALDEENRAVAIIDPQIIERPRPVVEIRNAAGRVYEAEYTTTLTFSRGQATVLEIELNKTAIGLSATAADWVSREPIELTPTAITVTGQLGDTDDFFRTKTIHVYKWGTNASGFWWDTYSYIQGQNGFVWSGTPRYWDDQVSPLNMTAFHFPVEGSAPTVSYNTVAFDWKIPANQSQKWNNYDLLSDYLPVSVPQALNFEFGHALSQVTVLLVSDQFTVPELEKASITLNNFVVDGSITAQAGTATATGVPVTVTPYAETPGVKYTALVMPQTIAATTNILTVTLPQYPNTPFQGQLSVPLELKAGVNNIITVRLRRTSIEMSATVKAWEDSNVGEIVIQ